MSSSATYSTLADRAAFGGSASLRNVTLALAGSLALWLSAKLQAPFYPVPVTMQTFVVLSIGTAFGWRLGAATVALYLAQGALGLPVFAVERRKRVLGSPTWSVRPADTCWAMWPPPPFAGSSPRAGWDWRVDHDGSLDAPG